MRCLFILFFICITCISIIAAQSVTKDQTRKVTVDQPDRKKKKKIKSLFGVASYYADKFIGRKTANGDVYHPGKHTAACNILPLGTWIRVTNVRNNRSVIVEVNDRMHPANKRVVDLSRIAAQQLGYIKRGLTQVRVEDLGKLKPKI
ncbi:MAG: septal ring lytic transglycosylase RlpA family protein [Chitinophagaceae bacterium]